MDLSRFKAHAQELYKSRQKMQSIQKKIELASKQNNQAKTRAAVIFFHKNLTKIYKNRWWQKCVVSVLEQSYQDFDILEVNYGGDGFCLMNEFKYHNKKAFFFNEAFDTHTEAMMFLLDKAFREMDYHIVFNTNLDDYYHESRFAKQVACIDQGYDLCSSYMTYITEERGVDKETMVWGSHRYGFDDIHFDVVDGASYVDLKNIQAQLAKDHNVINHSCVCFAKGFWEGKDKHGNWLRYRDDKPFEDLSLWQRAAFDSTVKLTIIPESLILYRLHENQIGEQSKQEKKDDHVDGGFKRQANKDTHVIGIFCICTGNYIEYLYQLLVSTEIYFLPGFKKRYFVSTDNEALVQDLARDMQIECFTQYTPKKGFPLDTLYRYKFFLEHGIRTELYCDVIYYLDVDMTVIDEVGPEILPTVDKRLVGTKHPGFAFSANKNGSPETRPESTAYIHPDNYKDVYIAGGFNGGFTYDFKQMAREIHRRINEDKAKDLMAVWHDESQLNKYFNEHFDRFKVLEPDYCYPENYHEDIPCEQRILALCKDHVQVRDRGEAKKIVVSAMGGLGNLCFQVFFGKFIEMQLNERYPSSRWEVVVSADQKDESRESIFHYHLFDNVTRVGSLPTADETYIVGEISKSYVDLLSDLTNEWHYKVFGYFQSPLYFQPRFKEIIAQMDLTCFQAAKETFDAFLKAIPLKKVLALHIRGGDYRVREDYHCLQTLEYYNHCLHKVPNLAEYCVLLFTDDKPYVDEFFSSLRYNFTAREIIQRFLPERYQWLQNSAETEMFLMALCHTIVCANSTYSLWASYFATELNPGFEKAFLPTRWFGINGPRFFATGELAMNDEQFELI